MNSVARGLLALVVILTVLLAFPCAALATDNCPLTLWGQWNGVYYYYCKVCTTTNGYNMVPAQEPHELSVDCPAINPIITVYLFKQQIGHGSKHGGFG